MCKRVLNIYRFLVMNVKLDATTWFVATPSRSVSQLVLLPAPTAVVWGSGVNFHSSCLFLRRMSQPMQLGSPNVTRNCSTMSPGNQFILGSKGQYHKSQKH